MSKNKAKSTVRNGFLIHRIPIPPIDLEHTAFKYRGRTVPGARLAELLGLADPDGEAPAPPGTPADAQSGPPAGE